MREVSFVRYLMGCLIITGIIYLIFGFAYWDFNPKNWEADSRGVFAFSSVAISLVYVAVWKSTEK